MAIRRGEGWLLHCGDAYFHHGEVQTPPHCPPGLRFFQNLNQTDGAARRENQERLRELAARHGDEVELICSHDPYLLEAAHGRAAPRRRRRLAAQARAGRAAWAGAPRAAPAGRMTWPNVQFVRILSMRDGCTGGMGGARCAPVGELRYGGELARLLAGRRALGGSRCAAGARRAAR